MNQHKAFRFLLFSTAVLLVMSCSRHVAPVADPQNIVIYPAPPDTARIQFLTSISSSENTTGKQSAMSKYIFGEEQAKPIKKPYGIAVKHGKIYVCDAGLSGLEIIDLAKNSFSYFAPSGLGKLQLPINCFVDDDGALYVADSERKQIVIFDKSGNYTGAVGEAENFKPTDVFVHEDEIWVTNIKNNCLEVYNKHDLKHIRSFPGESSDKSAFLYSPANIYITGSKVYVSDIGDFRVKIYSLDGKLVSSVGGTGTGLGKFARPKGIAVDNEGNLYVIDASFENAQIFNKEGKLLLFFGGPYKGPGDMWLPAKVTIDYDNLSYFSKYVYKGFDLKYLIFVTNQYGPDKINVYGAISPK